MNARLIKETRVLLPIFACMMPLMVVPQHHLAAAGLRLFRSGSGLRGDGREHFWHGVPAPDNLPAALTANPPVGYLAREDAGPGSRHGGEPGRGAGLPGGLRCRSRSCRVVAAGLDPLVRLLRRALLDAVAAAEHRRHGGRGGRSVRDTGDVCARERAVGPKRNQRRWRQPSSPCSWSIALSFTGRDMPSLSDWRLWTRLRANWACRLVWRPFLWHH